MYGSGALIQGLRAQAGAGAGATVVLVILSGAKVVVGCFGAGAGATAARIVREFRI